MCISSCLPLRPSICNMQICMARPDSMVVAGTTGQSPPPRVPSLRVAVSVLLLLVLFIMHARHACPWAVCTGPLFDAALCAMTVLGGSVPP